MKKNMENKMQTEVVLGFYWDNMATHGITRAIVMLSPTRSRQTQREMRGKPRMRRVPRLFN